MQARAPRAAAPGRLAPRSAACACEHRRSRARAPGQLAGAVPSARPPRDTPTPAPARRVDTSCAARRSRGGSGASTPDPSRARGGPGGPAPSSSTEDDEPAGADLQRSAEAAAEAAISHLRDRLSALQATRAGPELLDRVVVKLGGVETPLRSAASVVALDGGQSLRITPFSRNAAGTIEKAVRESGLGVSVRRDDDGSVRASLPPASAERRAELCRLAKREAESARAAVRGGKQKASKKLQVRAKEEGLGRDEKRAAEARLDKSVAQAAKRIDDMIKEKLRDLESI